MIENADTSLLSSEGSLPSVVVIGLASCFGCQLQITNMERELRDLLGQFHLSYWQLAQDGHLPERMDVAIIEGAVTTQESLDLVCEIRRRSRIVIAIGACATTAGIPGIAALNYAAKQAFVYDKLPSLVSDMCEPRSVCSVIEVDFEVFACPINSQDFAQTLNAALHGSNIMPTRKTMCSDCKRNETACFYEDGQLCLGLVTRAGCGACCVNLGRPCNGCRGLSDEANLGAARMAVARYGCDLAEFDRALELFNQTNIRIKHDMTR